VVIDFLAGVSVVRGELTADCRRFSKRVGLRHGPWGHHRVGFTRP